MSRIQAYLILILCYAGGALGVYGGMQEFLRARDSVQWPTVVGKVTSMEVNGRYVRDQAFRFYADMEYAYSVEGQEYQGDRLTFRPRDPSSYQDDRHGKQWTEQIAEEYPVGRSIQVYYSPRNPQLCILEPGASAEMLIPALIGGLIMAFPTIVVVGVMGREMLSPMVWYWLKIKLGWGESTESLSLKELPLVTWDGEIRETVDRWEPGVCVVLKYARSGTISLMFYSTVIGAVLGIAGGMFFAFSSDPATPFSAINRAGLIFAGSSLLLFFVSRFQDRQTATTIDWNLGTYVVKRDFARTRRGSIHDIQQIVVRCLQPRKEVKRFRATVELQLPSENVAVAQNEPLRRKPEVAKSQVAKLAAPLAEALGIPLVYEGFE